MKDAPSVSQIWNELGRNLHGFIRSRVPDPFTADDLLQETFLRIQKNIERLSDGERLRAWVFRIARNVVADHYRAKAHAAASLDFDPADDSDSGDDNFNAYIGQWLPDFIKRLPERYREAVRLYEIDDVSQQAIADQLGISLSGAKSRIQRGRMKLKKALNDCCVFQLDRRGNVIDYEGCGDSSLRSPSGSSCGCQ